MARPPGRDRFACCPAPPSAASDHSQQTTRSGNRNERAETRKYPGNSDPLSVIAASLRVTTRASLPAARYGADAGLGLDDLDGRGQDGDPAVNGRRLGSLGFLGARAEADLKSDGRSSAGAAAKSGSRLFAKSARSKKELELSAIRPESPTALSPGVDPIVETYYVSVTKQYLRSRFLLLTIRE